MNIHPYRKRECAASNPHSTATANIHRLNITPAEIEPGNEVTISFTITSSDNRTFTYTVTMQVGGLNVPIDVELGAYESKTVSQTITQYIPGDYNVTIDSLEGSFTVKFHEIPTPPLPPFLDNLNITPAEIERGDNITINFDIENYGNQSQTWRARASGED